MNFEIDENTFRSKNIGKQHELTASMETKKTSEQKEPEEREKEREREKVVRNLFSTLVCIVYTIVVSPYCRI